MNSPSDHRSDQAPSVNCELFVERGHVLQGLRAFRVPRKIRPRDRAIFGYDGAFLTVEAFDQMFVARATGTWPGNAGVAATLIAALISATPSGNPLRLRCNGMRVSIGNISVDCEWQPVSETLMAVPAARDWLASLALAFTLPRGKIITGGYVNEVADAERRLHQLLVRNAKSLAPLGVEVEDLRKLVVAKLQERFGSPPR